MRIDNMQNFYDILKGISEYSKASAFSWNEKDTLKKVSFEHFFDDVKTVMTMLKTSYYFRKKIICGLFIFSALYALERM